MEFIQLTEEEEKELYRLVSLGCNRAVSKLVEANLGLVLFVAKKYNVGANTNSMSFDELLSEGAIGLTTAVKRFNDSSGNKLSTYAVWWIRQAISHALIWKTRTVRLPTHIVLKSRNYIRQLEELEKDGACENKKDLAGYKAYRLTEDSTSLDEENEDELAKLDILESNESDFIEESFNAEMLKKLPDLILKLKPRYRDVLIKRYGIGCKAMTLEQLGAEMKITRERVRQLQTAATKKLREELLKLI